MMEPGELGEENWLAEGVRRLGAGEFHAAHDAFEEGWRGAEGSVRSLAQALVQIAAGLHQWSRGNREGAARLLGRAAKRLGNCPSALLGLDVAALELWLQDWQAGLAQGASAPAEIRLALGAETTALPPETLRAQCPYCGERVTVRVDPVGATSERSVEDCPVCCRPWSVEVTRRGADVSLELFREDA